ncbi:MAG: acyltransferase [Chloroflexi bacterium]|nr:acyltransferase [Chloroflexota bacterium]
MFARYSLGWNKDWRLYGVPIIQRHRDSVMQFGPRLQLRSSLRSNPLGPNHPVFLTTWQAGAILKIGGDFGMTGGTICAAESIVIGDRVAIGANTTIIDTDFHPLDAHWRQEHPADARTAPIVIEDDVFVGMHCLILKGVRLGQGCVIGAGSVVTKTVSAGTLAVGNPARLVGPRQIGHDIVRLL